jgi:hypothetical protein
MKYFIPLTLLSENGNPIRSDMVELRDSNNTVVYTLSYWKAGQYYNDAPIAFGDYDIYVDGYFYADISISERVGLDNETIGIVGGEISALSGGFISGNLDTPYGNLTPDRPGQLYYSNNTYKLFIAMNRDENNPTYNWNSILGEPRNVNASTDAPLVPGEIAWDTERDIWVMSEGGINLLPSDWRPFGWDPDNLTLEVIGGIISVKDNGITDNKLQHGGFISGNLDTPYDNLIPDRPGQFYYSNTTHKLFAAMERPGIDEKNWWIILLGEPRYVDASTDVPLAPGEIVKDRERDIWIMSNGVNLPNWIPFGYSPDDVTIELDANHKLAIKTGAFSGEVEDLIYKEGIGNPNVHNVIIDRLGQIYCNLNNNATFVAVNSGNPTWKKLT